MRAGLGGLLGIALLLAACSSPDRSAAPEPLDLTSYSSEESASTDYEPEPEPESSAPVTGPGGRKSTRVCIENRDAIGVWQNYITWTKFDTNTGSQPAFGETVCAEGGSSIGEDVIGVMYLSDGKRDVWTEVKFSGDNRWGLEILEPPVFRASGAGLNYKGPYSVGDYGTLTTKQAGAPSRTIKIERLPDTAWKEFKVTILN